MLNNIPAEHFWFMYSLIRIYLIYPFIRYMFEKNNKSLIYVLIFCMFFSFEIEFLNTSFDIYFRAIFYFAGKIFSNGIIFRWKISQNFK